MPQSTWQLAGSSVIFIAITHSKREHTQMHTCMGLSWTHRVGSQWRGDLPGTLSSCLSGQTPDVMGHFLGERAHPSGLLYYQWRLERVFWCQFTKKLEEQLKLKSILKHLAMNGVTLFWMKVNRFLMYSFHIFNVMQYVRLLRCGFFHENGLD